MADSDLVPGRVILVAFGAVQLLNGTWALLAPRSFYEEFPFGRGWAELLPDYSEHLVRDLGALYLATAFMFLGAALLMTRATVLLACGAWLTFALPHAVYHAFHLSPFATGDAVANAIVLAGAVLLPAGLIAVLVREPGRRAPRTAPARLARGRIEGVPDTTRHPLLRASFRMSRRRYGAVMEPLRVFGHHPRLLMGYAALELASERSQLAPARVKHLAELRAGMICGCEWCLDFGSSISADAGVDEDDLRELASYQESARFSATEKLALEYATGMSRSPVDVSDALFEQLRAHFDAPELVELTSIIALENYRARFNWALGIEDQGFSEGAFCVPPEGTQRQTGVDTRGGEIQA